MGLQGVIRDKIAKGTQSQLEKKKSVCLALSMNYDYSGGKKSEPLPKAWRVKGQLEFSARDYNALLVP